MHQRHVFIYITDYAKEIARSLDISLLDFVVGQDKFSTSIMLQDHTACFLTSSTGISPL